MNTDGVYETVENCAACGKNRVHSKKRHLQLFPPQHPMDTIYIDMLGPFTKTKNGSQFILVITDRYRNLTSAVPTTNITAISSKKLY